MWPLGNEYVTKKYLPFEQNQIGVTVILGKAVAKDTVWVATSDLMGWEAKVNALDKVP